MSRAVKRWWESVVNVTKIIDEKMLWDFRRKETVDQWSVLDDSGEVGGKSKARLEPNGKGSGVIFHGNINTETPPGSEVLYSGFAAITSNNLKGSLTEPNYIDISNFDAFLIRIRSDGRKYLANVRCHGMMKNHDVWQYFVFPRGGPEWENIIIPFDSFFITHRGTLQDFDRTFNRSYVATFGMILGDNLNGPFRLEMQYIKAVRSPVHQFMAAEEEREYQRN